MKVLSLFNKDKRFVSFSTDSIENIPSIFYTKEMNFPIQEINSWLWAGDMDSGGPVPSSRDKLSQLYSNIFSEYSPETFLLYITRQLYLLCKKFPEIQDKEFMFLAKNTNSLVDNYLKSNNLHY
jgi:hypothetical protein